MDEKWYDSSTREQECCSGEEARYKKIVVTASGLGFEARVGEVPKMPQAQQSKVEKKPPARIESLSLSLAAREPSPFHPFARV